MVDLEHVSSRNIVLHNRMYLAEGRYKTTRLEDKEIARICAYLENPTRTGVWVLTAKWLKEGGISDYFITIMKELSKSKEDVETPSGKPRSSAFIKSFMETDPINTTTKLTFVFTLFDYLLSVERGEDIELHPPYKTIFGLVDLGDLKKKYSEAYKCFKENIYLEGFDPVVDFDKLLRVKTGIFSVSDDEKYDPRLQMRKEKMVFFTSLDIEPLKKLKDFYEKTGKITNAYLAPVYSPEEEVFAPYFLIAESVYNHLISNEGIRRLFESSISEYKERKYSNSIRMVGLIAEDYLTQIYETLFRDVCPKGLTLWQIYDLIDNSIKKSEIKTPVLPAVDDLYKQISELIEKSPSEVEVGTLKMLREILTYIKDDRKQIQKMLRSTEKDDESISVFPRRIKENLTELIKYRNSVSHKSRVPIGDYDALRAVYCCIALIIWWNNEKKQVKWEEDKDNPATIIKEMIERNNPANQTK